MKDFLFLLFLGAALYIGSSIIGNTKKLVPPKYENEQIYSIQGTAVRNYVYHDNRTGRIYHLSFKLDSSTEVVMDSIGLHLLEEWKAQHDIKE